MSPYEAIKINDFLLKQAKNEAVRGNESMWAGERCCLCARILAEGDWFISYCPEGYRDQRKVETFRTHVECIDRQDRWRHERSIHVARRSDPILPFNRICDIIYVSSQED